MDDAKMIQELIDYSKVLYERKLIHATGGNTSVRKGDVVWISQTGAKLGELSEREIVKVDLEGNVLDGTAPSKEMGMHLAMFQARKDVNAVIHVHPTFSVAHSTTIKEATEDAIPPLHGGILCSCRPGSYGPLSCFRSTLAARSGRGTCDELPCTVAASAWLAGFRKEYV